MGYQTTSGKITLNKNKRIGKVLFIVEGEKTEPMFLRLIFTQIFNFKFVRIYRDETKKPYLKLESSVDPNSCVFVINAEDSNIARISDENTYLDRIFENLIDNYDFPFDNAAIYYLFDRDAKSNTDAKLIEALIGKLTNPRDTTDDFNRQGLLLLSYPSIESFTASSFPNLIGNAFDISVPTGHSLKNLLNTKKALPNKFSEETICMAAQQMHYALSCIGLKEYDIDNIKPLTKKVFNWQENYYEQHSEYKLLSLLSIALLDLGLIEIE